MNQKLKTKIKGILEGCLRAKFEKYSPETKYMPFHTNLLGKDRMALFSFIHSISTSLGLVTFEQIAKEIGLTNFKTAERNVKVGSQISADSEQVIQGIMNDLSTAKTSPDKEKEITEIRKVCNSGTMKKSKPTKVDLKLESHSGEIYLIDIKSVKPNIGEFKGFKRTLLEWVAVYLAANPTAKVHTLLAMPYNPYHPESYARWTMKGMIDINNELKVAEEFWDFLGGEGTYDALLDIFEEVGVEMRDEIDAYFAKFK
ncbi:MAG: TdeIII family type II restriction endonuclease [Candidatus Cloacimonadaceae bacterium]|jgi:type II restriction enzyme|nr:TdeIII family type II restriction endonuclease [Candidatus Cloacimonadota bacterium]MDX9949434.1 TdeIII family type II restriction endonuclease [Candidatus Syntrophosphaera sp.]